MTYCIRKSHYVIFVILFVCNQNDSFCQGIRDSLFEEVKSKLEPLISNLGNTSLKNTEEYNLFVVDAILNLKDEEVEPVNQDRFYDLKIKQLEQNWGVNLRAQLNNNFDNYFFNQDEFDDQQTPMRFRMGLDWELMKNGLLSHQNKIQQLENEKEAAWLEYDKKRNQERYFYRYNVLIFYFNVEKIKILKERKRYLEEQINLLYRIYYIRDIMFEEIIAMKGELEQVEVQLNNYIEYNSLMETTFKIDEFPADIDVMRLPVLDLDINDLLSDSAHILDLKKIHLLEKENDRLKNAAVNDVSLRLQLYQNLGFADPNSPQRTYTSGGVVASVPLELFYRGKLPDQIADEKASIALQKAKYMNLNTATEIVNYYYEFNYKMKTYVQFLYKYMLYEEKLRVEQVDRVHFTDYYQPFRILKYYDQLQLIRLELIDLKQQLYLFLLRIYAKTNIKSIKDYLKPVASLNYFAKLPASRTIFMNEDDFDKFDPHFIENYLRFNDFNYAILEEDVVDIFHDRNRTEIKEINYVQFVKTLPWNNSYTNMRIYAELVNEGLELNGYSGIMVKVPSADIGAKGSPKTDSLVQRLESFFVELQNIDPEIVIFLNLPVSFPFEDVTKLSGWTEKIVLRMENEDDLLSIKSLPDRMLPFDYLPICVSLDVNRFVDRLKLEAYINQIIIDKRINDIVFNDFQAFVTMETKMFSDKLND